jgi:hypothetical protein
MLGRNPLWVAQQHGHSISTMLSIYAAGALCYCDGKQTVVMIRHS